MSDTKQQNCENADSQCRIVSGKIAWYSESMKYERTGVTGSIGCFRDIIREVFTKQHIHTTPDFATIDEVLIYTNNWLLSH